MFIFFSNNSAIKLDVSKEYRPIEPKCGLDKKFNATELEILQ